VLAETVSKARALELPVHLLTAGYDVDDRVTLARLCHDLVDANRDEEEFAAKATRSFLREIIDREGRNRICPE
jgi:hypothetical protein